MFPWRGEASKNGRCVGLTILPLLHVDCVEIWEPEAPGTLRVCPGLYRDCYTSIVPLLRCVSLPVFLNELYRVSQEECARVRESVPYVKLYRYNPKHLYPKLNGYGDNGHRKVWASEGSTYCTPSVTPYLNTAHARQRNITS